MYVAGDGCGGVCDFGASAVVDAHGEGADGVVTGFAFALFELFDDVFPEFGAAACPADAYSQDLRVSSWRLRTSVENRMMKATSLGERFQFSVEKA